jgi:hypothetical protein
MDEAAKERAKALMARVESVISYNRNREAADVLEMHEMREFKAAAEAALGLSGGTMDEEV